MPPSWVPMCHCMQNYCEPYFTAVSRWRKYEDEAVFINRIQLVEAASYILSTYSTKADTVTLQHMHRHSHPCTHPLLIQLIHSVHLPLCLSILCPSVPLSFAPLSLYPLQYVFSLEWENDVAMLAEVEPSSGRVFKVGGDKDAYTEVGLHCQHIS
jgi:hypothetical protein